MKLIPYLLLLTTALFTSCADSEDGKPYGFVWLTCDDESKNIPPCTVCEECPGLSSWIASTRMVNVSAVIDTFRRSSVGSKWTIYRNSKQDDRFFLALNPNRLSVDFARGWMGAYSSNDHPKYPWNQGEDGVDYCDDYPDRTICRYGFLKFHLFQDDVRKLNLKDSDAGKSIALNGYVYMYYIHNLPMKENPSGPCDIVKGHIPLKIGTSTTYFVPCIPK